LQHSSRSWLEPLVAALDEDDVPLAVTWRLVSDAAANVGFPRPSYPNVRRLALAERRRRRLQRELRSVITEAMSTAAGGRTPNYDYTLGRLLDAHAALAAERACVSETQALSED